MCGDPTNVHQPNGSNQLVTQRKTGAQKDLGKMCTISTGNVVCLRILAAGRAEVWLARTGRLLFPCSLSAVCVVSRQIVKTCDLASDLREALMLFTEQFPQHRAREIAGAIQRGARFIEAMYLARKVGLVWFYAWKSLCEE